MKDLNLIPKSYMLHKAKRRLRIYVSGGIALCILLLANGIVLPMQKKSVIEKQISEMDNKVKETTGFVTKEKLLSNLKGVYSEREKEANKLFGLGFDISTVFDTIEKSLTEKIFLMGMSITEGTNGDATAEMNCIYETEEEIASFINNLRESGCFDSIIIKSMNKISGDTKLPSTKTTNAKTTTTKTTTTKVNPKSVIKQPDKFTSAISLHIKSKR